jgi:hypothetical protein
MYPVSAQRLDAIQRRIGVGNQASEREGKIKR